MCKFDGKLLHEAILINRPITLLMTGPMTPLIDVLKKDTRLAQGVGQIVWMGGAIDAPGNLDPSTINPVVANKHAEWNAFWDPYSVDDVFRRFGGIHMFPLDISNSAAVTAEFLDALKQQGERLDSSRFLRINRSCLIRVAFIQDLHVWSHGEYHVVLLTGEVHTWTRRYLDRHPELLHKL